MTTDPRRVLVDGLAELGLDPGAAAVDQLLALDDLVREANEQVNLTAITEPVAMVRKHLLDSLSVQPWIEGPFVIDVGSGAGFPGLPLAIANPALRFTLLDSTAKKVRFLEHAARTLGLAQVAAVCSRAEHFQPPQRAQTVVSRALASVAEFVRVAGHLCARSGRLLAMKGKDPAAELAGLPRGWQVVALERLKVPGLDDARHLVILRAGAGA